MTRNGAVCDADEQIKIPRPCAVSLRRVRVVSDEKRDRLGLLPRVGGRRSLVALQRDRPKFILVYFDRELAKTAPAPCARRSHPFPSSCHGAPDACRNPLCRPCTGLPFRIVATDREHGQSTLRSRQDGCWSLMPGQALNCHTAQSAEPLALRDQGPSGDRLSAECVGGLAKGNAGGSGHRRRHAAHADRKSELLTRAATGKLYSCGRETIIKRWGSVGIFKPSDALGQHDFLGEHRTVGKQMRIIAG